jgi:serine/threonine-protein kinase
MTTEQIDLLSQALAERFAVLRQVGHGGMATVYLAHDLKHDRRVAVKVLHPQLAQSIGADRFLREIRLAATLQHPHVLGLYDSGEADGLLYYVMPFVEGESLRDRLARDQQLPIDEALSIAAEVANALGYAHSRGVVHRDIKPENVLLSHGHAVVADFGIAHAMSEAGSDRLTESGIAMGTPRYMSPEQGRAANPGPLSDVYAVGCVLYEMLAGEPPFTGPNAMSIIAKHAMADVPSVRVLRPTVSDEVDHVIQRALAKSTADRWPSAAALEQALRLAAAEATASRSGARPMPNTPPGGGVAAGDGATHGATRGVTAGVATHAPRSRALAAGVGALVVAAGVAAGTMIARRTGDRAAPALGDGSARRLAVLYFDAPRGDTALSAVADGFTEALATTLGEVQGLSVASPNAVLPLRGATVTLDSAARALRVGTLITGALEPEAGSRVRVTLALRDASGATFADTSLVRPASDVLGLREAVVDQAAAMVRRRIGEEFALRASVAGTESAEAWSLAQRGLAEKRRAAVAVRAGDSVATARADAAADSLLALAESRDPKWRLPPVERAKLAYEQSRRRGPNGSYAAPYIARGLGHAEAAVALDSSADALAIRGMLRYWRWLARAGSTDIAERQALVNSARADLERATRDDPAQADAWNSLSHLYANFATVLDAKLAAKRAYDLDPYLTGAEALLWRLYSTSYDLAQFEDARRYCAEVGTRFPQSPRGAECALWLQSVPDAPTPSPARAWAAAAERARLAPAAQRAALDVDSRYAVAAALARAGLADSARHVAQRAYDDSLASRVEPTRAAWVMWLLRDRAHALSELKRLVAEQGTTPDQARRITTQHWWWRDLRDDREFRAIFSI